jgi:hypothetical protein
MMTRKTSLEPRTTSVHATTTSADRDNNDPDAESRRLAELAALETHANWSQTMNEAGYPDGWVVEPLIPVTQVRSLLRKVDPLPIRLLPSIYEWAEAMQTLLRDEHRAIDVITNVPGTPVPRIPEIIRWLTDGGEAPRIPASASAPTDVRADFQTRETPDPLQESIKRHSGGRPKGWRKGRVWDLQEIVDWYHAYVDFGNEPPTLKTLGEDMGVSDDTAKRRVIDVGLRWPPHDHPALWDLDN